MGSRQVSGGWSARDGDERRTPGQLQARRGNWAAYAKGNERLLRMLCEREQTVIAPLVRE